VEDVMWLSDRCTYFSIDREIDICFCHRVDRFIDSLNTLALRPSRKKKENHKPKTLVAYIEQCVKDSQIPQIISFPLSSNTMNLYN
jgi:hypothetical protein